MLFTQVADCVTQYILSDKINFMDTFPTSLVTPIHKFLTFL